MVAANDAGRRNALKPQKKMVCVMRMVEEGCAKCWRVTNRFKNAAIVLPTGVSISVLSTDAATRLEYANGVADMRSPFQSAGNTFKTKLCYKFAILCKPWRGHSMLDELHNGC